MQVSINSSIAVKKINSKIVVFDILALTAIYFVPILLHQFSLSIYYIEPMRMILVSSLLFANFSNSLILVATLPLFSFIISAHPVLAKSLLISSELLVNVVLFYWFKSFIKNLTLCLAYSIILSKVYYYFVKYLLLKFVILTGALVSTPISIQLVVSIVIIFSYFLVLKYSANNNKKKFS